MLSPHVCLVCPDERYEESVRSRPGELHDDASAQHAAGCAKRASPSRVLDDEASGCGTPPLHYIHPRTPVELLPPLRKRRRRAMTIPAAQEQEVRRMLKLADCRHSNLQHHAEGGDVPILAMNSTQFSRKRDLGLAMLVMVSNQFDASARTFVLASSIFDRFLAKTVKVVPSTGTVQVPQATQLDPNAAAQAAEMPLACFLMACKFCETYAPRLADLVAAVGDGCTVSRLRDAENSILASLRWDVESLTALDLLDKLLGFSTPQRAQQLTSKAEMGVKVACCSRSISKHQPAVVAVGVLLNACEQHNLSEDYLDFVPSFLLTDEARMCAQQLKSFIADHVRAHPKLSTVTATAVPPELHDTAPDRTHSL